MFILQRQLKFYEFLFYETVNFIYNLCYSCWFLLPLKSKMACVAVFGKYIIHGTLKFKYIYNIKLKSKN